MDFKSRFHGKTSVLTKQGLTTLFSAPGNPIVKYAPPPYQEMNPQQYQYSDAQFYKNQIPTHQKPTSSVAAFRPKVIVKKTNRRPSNYFEFNNYIGPVQNPEEQFGKMSKSLLATLNKKAKEREALCEITTPGTSAKKSQTAREFQKSDKNLLMRNNSGEVSKFLSQNEKQDLIRSLVVPEREVINTPIRQQVPQNFRNTYNDPQYTQRLVLSRQKSRNAERKNSSPDYHPDSSGYNIPLRSSFSGLPLNQNEFRNTGQKDVRLTMILSRDRDAYGIGSRERYFKNFRQTRRDLTDRSEINLLSKSLNAEERIAQSGDYQDYVYEGNARNRSNSYVQEASVHPHARMNKLVSSNRAATTERFRLPNIEKEGILKMGMSRVFDQNSSFKTLPSRRQY